MTRFRSLTGMHDRMTEVPVRRHIEDTVRRVVTSFGFSEWQLPIVEESSLFLRLGPGSDVVRKEMYTFTDPSGDVVTLRPEGTVGVCRAFLEAGLEGQGLPRKVFYSGPMFRFERPQAGRYREFQQVGVEVLGVDDPYMDAEVIAAGWQVIKELGLTDKATINIGTLGGPEARQAYTSALVAYLEKNWNRLSTENQERANKNPLRVLDSDIEEDRAVISEAPSITYFMPDEDLERFEEVCEALREMEVPFTKNHRLVRGLDYYTGTVFEFVAKGLGAQSTVLGGGRYNGLIEELGGPSMPAIGWAAGLDRLSLLVEPPAVVPKASVVWTEPGTRGTAIKIANDIRKMGVIVDMSWRPKVKTQMERANKVGADFVVIIGPDEIAAESFTIKNMVTGDQRTLEMCLLETAVRVNLRRAKEAAIAT